MSTPGPSWIWLLLPVVAVVLAASLLLSERIAPTSWLGIAFIVVGIVLVSTAMRS